MRWLRFAALAICLATSAQATNTVRVNFFGGHHVVYRNMPNPQAPIETPARLSVGGVTSTFSLDNAFDRLISSGFSFAGLPAATMVQPMGSNFSFDKDLTPGGFIQFNLGVYTVANAGPVGNISYFSYTHDFVASALFPAFDDNGNANFRQVGNNFIFDFPALKSAYGSDVTEAATYCVNAENDIGDTFSDCNNFGIKSVVIGDLIGVPEPASWASLGLGFGVLGTIMRGRRSRRPKRVLA